jgi:hypothetical protein
MEIKEISSLIVESWPYPILFADSNHIIKFLNRQARNYYYTERGFRELIGKSLLDLHNGPSREGIIAAVEKLKDHGSELFLRVNVRNQRMYLSPVRDENGELLGYYTRYELNFRKE